MLLRLLLLLVRMRHCRLLLLPSPLLLRPLPLLLLPWIRAVEPSLATVQLLRLRRGLRHRAHRWRLAGTCVHVLGLLLLQLLRCVADMLHMLRRTRRKGAAMQARGHTRKPALGRRRCKRLARSTAASLVQHATKRRVRQACVLLLM